MELLIATTNRDKIKELRPIFAQLLPDGLVISTLHDLPGEPPDVVEDRETFHGNAIKKALEVSVLTGRSVMSEDSGLEVDALGGAPGVYSGRYAGLTPRSDEANNRKLIAALAPHPPPLTARYVAVACLALSPDDEVGAWMIERLGASDLAALPHGEPQMAGVPGLAQGRVVVWWRGECEGEITREPGGSGGFGYDPHFYVPALGRTLAEVTLEEKSALSHRREALDLLSAATRTGNA